VIHSYDQDRWDSYGQDSWSFGLMKKSILTHLVFVYTTRIRAW